jgi:hypothetical protein
MQSASVVHVPASEQNTSSAQKHLWSPIRMKQNDSSPTSLLQDPQGEKPSLHGATQSVLPMHRRCDFFFVQRAVEARAGRLVSTGAAQAAAPASPMVRSISRREIRLPSILTDPPRSCRVGAA